MQGHLVLLLEGTDMLLERCPPPTAGCGVFSQGHDLRGCPWRSSTEALWTTAQPSFTAVPLVRCWNYHTHLGGGC